MNLNEKNLELQVQIWALIGPVIALATVITLYFQGASQNVVLGLAILLGMLACWWWKTKGLIGALVGITLLGSYQFLNQPTEEPFWNIGITFAIALTFLVTALSFEEVETIVGGIQTESASRLKSLLKLDEKLERVQSKLQEEKKVLLDIVKEREHAMHHQEKLIQLSRDEIVTSHRRNEELLTEIYAIKIAHEKEKENTQLSPASDEMLQENEQLRYELTKAQDHYIVTSEQAKREADKLREELTQLRKQLNSQNDELSYSRIEIDTLNRQLTQANEKTAQFEQELTQARQQIINTSDETGYAQIEIDTLNRQLAQANERIKQSEQELISVRQQILKNSDENSAAQHTIDTLKRELIQAQDTIKLAAEQIKQANENAKEETTILKNAITSLQEKLNIKTQEVAAKEDERSAIHEQLKAQLVEMESLKAQVEAAGTINIAEAESRELRRINGLYQQLRLQFEEKSNVLDAARRELFATQERLTREQLDQRERQYEGTEYEKELQRCLEQLEDEQRELNQAHQREVEQLQELISQMMCCA